jgi:putative Mg2+ transporter-C (MgtC) family protein
MDLNSLADLIRLDLLGSLLLAAVLGATIGLEREITGKEAGLRTMMLICIGSALLTELSVSMATGSLSDATRISAAIVSGIGFLGAGVIITDRGRVRGLTTAATIWVVAAIGIACGAGQYVEAIGTTVLVLVVLVPLRWWERRIPASRHAADEGDAADG